MLDKIRKELLAQFDIDESIALEDLTKAAHETKRHNCDYGGSMNQNISDLTPGQLEILTRFGKLYSLDRKQIDTTLTIATNGKILGIRGPSSEMIGLNYHCPDFLFTEEKLTEHGYALVDILAEAVKGYISQYEASAIMSCIGFHTPSDKNPVRDDFERHLTGRKGYTPGVYREIIAKTPANQTPQHIGRTGWGGSTN